MAVVMGSACATTTAPVAATSEPTITASVASATRPTTGRGNIIGAVATDPWHDIKNGGVVFLEDGPKDTKTPLSATLDNHDMAFVPNIAVVAAGGSVIFTNTDPIMHNVFTPDGDKWNLGEIPHDGSTVKRFDNPGSYVILCNLHQDMRAYLVVTPSSYFARTDANGAFVIKDVPAGTYRVTAWVPRLKSVTKTVTVASADTTLNFALER